MEGVDHQQAWEVTTKWLHKKYKLVNPDTIKKAAEVLEEMGLGVGRLPGRRSRPPPPSGSPPDWPPVMSVVTGPRSRWLWSWKRRSTPGLLR